MMVVRNFKNWAAALLMITAVAQAQQTASHYFTGDGGKDIRLAVLEPAGKGLSEDDKWMLSLVQGSIYTDFSKYSGMTIIDKQNIEKIFEEWEKSMSGNYSDADRVKIGNLTNASHILSGTVIKTPNAFMLELSVTDLQSGERKASYSQSVSATALENHSAIKAASAELLGQLGVNLTSAALGELKQATNIARIQAEEALARGIVAKRQGTEVAALSYFFQAAILDPSLAEAVNRSSVMAANVSSGNIGEDARNDVAWRKSWVKRLEEAERYIDHLNKTVSMPYTLFYSDEIIKGNINYEKETMPITIKTNLYGNGSIRIWAQSVQKALDVVYDGLVATGRKEVWGLDWPRKNVTQLGAFKRQGKEFKIAAELVNSQNKVIGKQEFKLFYSWGYGAESWGYKRPEVRVSSDSRKNVTFKDVNVNDITDNLTIRFASVNGEAAVTAAKKGILQIKAMCKSEFDENDKYTFEFGEISEYKWGTDVDLNVDIPSTIWNDPVISIGKNVFFRYLRNGKLIGVTIPNGVTSIGKSAFYSNKLTSITIPNSVTYIGPEAFNGNNFTTVTIGENVNVDKPSFGNQFYDKFVECYENNGKRAGTYNTTLDGYGNYNYSSSWRYVDISADTEENRGFDSGLQELGGGSQQEASELSVESAAQSSPVAQTETERSAYTYSGGDYSAPERPAYTYSGIDDSFLEESIYSDEGVNDSDVGKSDEPIVQPRLLYASIGGFAIVGQQSEPVYDPAGINLACGVGGRIGKNVHAGVHLDMNTNWINMETMRKKYPGLRYDDELEIDSISRAIKINGFARWYPANYMFLSVGTGVWFHRSNEVNLGASSFSTNKLTMLESETALVFSAGIGFVIYFEVGRDLLFDIQYNALMGEEKSLSQYFTFSIGCQFGRGDWKKAN